MNFSHKLLLAAVATFAPVMMQAATISSDPTLSVGGMTFSNFTCSVSKGGIVATPSNCGQINVDTITAPAMGIQITSGFTAAAFSFDDAVITYHLTSDTGISNVGLSFNGFFLGMGVTSVTESVFSGNQLVGFATVACGSPSLGATCDRTDNIMLNGTYTDLHIEKDINVTAAAGIAGASIVDQTFTATPEPSSMALIGSGLLGAFGLLRRKANKGAQTV